MSFSRFLNSKVEPTGFEGLSADKNGNSVACQHCSLKQCLLPAIQMCNVHGTVSAQAMSHLNLKIVYVTVALCRAF